MKQDTSGDRELLELAAKAAGYTYNRLWFDAESGLMVWEPPTDYESRDWNPLTDDGDALRLAVKLALWVHIGRYGVSIEGTRIEECSRHDMYAATRRAIVRAAAEIGRKLEGGTK